MYTKSRIYPYIAITKSFIERFIEIDYIIGLYYISGFGSDFLGWTPLIYTLEMFNYFELQQRFAVN